MRYAQRGLDEEVPVPCAPALVFSICQIKQSHCDPFPVPTRLPLALRGQVGRGISAALLTRAPGHADL